jgi:hypothetical protein
METKTQTKKVIIDSGRNKSCNVVQCIKWLRIMSFWHILFKKVIIRKTTWK